EKILRFHSLKRRGEFRSATKTRHGKRARCVPTPADREHRRIEQCLNEKIPHGFRIQITKNFVQREGMLSPERDDNRIVGGRGLEFEIKRSTKTFPQRQPPRAIDPIPEGRMQNELHPARFIEETLHHERLLRWNRPERAISVGEIIRNLLRSF